MVEQEMKSEINNEPNISEFEPTAEILGTFNFTITVIF